MLSQKEFEKITNSIQEKLGEENVGKIADDLGKLITDNASANSLVKEKDAQIDKLKQEKEVLITTNGNLLQQVSMGTDDSFMGTNEPNKKEEPRKRFNYRDAFDEKGNFKRN